MDYSTIKKRSFLKGLSVAAVSATLPLNALAKSPVVSGTILDRELKTGWQFRQVDSTEWLAATVPGTVHTDLLANKKIDDPFFRTNEAALQWIDKKDWEYRTTLSVDAATLKRQTIELHFEGLDTYADVYVNEHLVLKTDNMFREWTADVKAYLKPGANSVRIFFHSPIKVGLEKLKAYGFNLPATNDQSENGGMGADKVSVFTRKAGYAYGWDWGPRFVTSGIWRKVRLRAWDVARITNVQLVQDSVTADAAKITAVVEVEADRSENINVDIYCAAEPKIRARAQMAVKPGTNVARLSFTIIRPKLWWSNGLGEAHLYAVTAHISSGKTTLDSRTTNLGVRTLKIVQTPDDKGSSFYVELNGLPVFMKGANYIPNDSFLPRVTHATYDKVIDSAVRTHMNMIRVWGGGVYEDDYFYDQCDKHGLLIWHDFMFACSMYPDDAAFMDNVRQEAVQNVRRLRNHPSIALWCGNNEIDTAWQNDVPDGGWGWKKLYNDNQKARIWAAYTQIFYNILPSVVAEHDAGRFYTPSSPLAKWDGKAKVEQANVDAPLQSGDIHYWDVWWGQKPFEAYRTHIGRFMSEYGFQSFPEFNSIKTYAIPSDYDIFSDVMKAHQRSSIGNGTIKNYMTQGYRVPADFRQFLYVGQVLQAEGIKVAMEAHRSRMPYCMGSLFWQINDCWPVASWSSIDYYGRWKAQQYFAAKAFEEVLVSPQIDDDRLSVYLVSDRHTDRAVTLSLRLIDFTGKVFSDKRTSLTLRTNTGDKVVSQDVAALLAGAARETTLLNCRVLDGTRVLAENTVYFRPVKDLALPKPEIKHVVRRQGNDILLAVTSSVLVKNLYLSLDEGEGRWSDNYFDLLPGETVIVRYSPSSEQSAAQFTKALRMVHMADIA